MDLVAPGSGTWRWCAARGAVPMPNKTEIFIAAHRRALPLLLLNLVQPPHHTWSTDSIYSNIYIYTLHVYASTTVYKGILYSILYTECAHFDFARASASDQTSEPSVA
jgi:hypothetical protein